MLDQRSNVNWKEPGRSLFFYCLFRAVQDRNKLIVSWHFQLGSIPQSELVSAIKLVISWLVHAGWRRWIGCGLNCRPACLELVIWVLLVGEHMWSSVEGGNGGCPVASSFMVLFILFWWFRIFLLSSRLWIQSFFPLSITLFRIKARWRAPVECNCRCL